MCEKTTGSLEANCFSQKYMYVYMGFENFVSYKLEFLYKFNVSLRYRRNMNIYIMMCVNGLITKFPKGHFSHQLIEGLTIYIDVN